MEKPDFTKIKKIKFLSCHYDEEVGDHGILFLFTLKECELEHRVCFSFFSENNTMNVFNFDYPSCSCFHRREIIHDKKTVSLWVHHFFKKERIKLSITGIDIQRIFNIYPKP